MYQNQFGELESRIKQIKDPRIRRSFLQAIYCDLMGYNAAKRTDSSDITANSPNLLKGAELAPSDQMGLAAHVGAMLTKYGQNDLGSKLIEKYLLTPLDMDIKGYSAFNALTMGEVIGLKNNHNVLYLHETEGLPMQIVITNDGEALIHVADKLYSESEAKQDILSKMHNLPQISPFYFEGTTLTIGTVEKIVKGDKGAVPQAVALEITTPFYESVKAAYDMLQNRF